MAKQKIVILTLMLMVFGTASQGQDMKGIFEPQTEITWLGLDFTGAKFIGDRERLGSTSDVQRLMQAWNDLMVKEKDKFNMARALDKPKDKVIVNVDAAREHNANLDVTEMFSDDPKDNLHLKPDDIVGIFSEYDFKDATGLGVMFNVESFNKLDEQGSIWVTFVNLGSKEILFSERLVGQPGGIGLRNFWAGAVMAVLERMKKKEFEMWRKKYYRK